MLGPLIAKLLTGEAGIFIARLKRMAVLYALMGVAALFLVIFLLIAAWLWAAQSVGTLPAALYFALGFLVIVIALYVGVLIIGRPPKERASDRLQRDVASIAGIAAVSNLPVILRSMKRRKGLLILPVAGVAIWGALRAFASRRNL
ncbi:hypothetical protein [Aureimonas frigidaquae]|uniref:hypothetical protein n=1 Tax=Aureimonas frigidaquae TaxID=424757 RepID=UPI0007818A7E|nr:hypothetical protein [Aureimonas frigidaquae]